MALPASLLARLAERWAPASASASGSSSISLSPRAESWIKAFRLMSGGSPPGYYSKLVRRAQRNSPPAVAKQIEKDLHRTFGSLSGVRVPDMALQALRRVLLVEPPGTEPGRAPIFARQREPLDPRRQAFAEHNPQVGYCQSMNFIAGVLLLVVDEETSFWGLSCVVEKLLPGYFDRSMVMALVHGLPPP